MGHKEDHLDVSHVLDEKRRQQAEQDKQDNLHLVAAAMQDKRLSMHQRRQQAEKMVIQALRRLRHKS